MSNKRHKQFRDPIQGVDHSSGLAWIGEAPDDLFGQIQYVDPNTLKPNPTNRHIFDPPNESEYKIWKEDIQERGIQNPLLADADKKTLIAGETRWKIAKDLGIKVPVRFAGQKLTEENRTRALIIDNLFRRQLKFNQKLKCYFMLFGSDFNAQILKEHRGRKGQGLTYKKIAEISGQNLGTVKKELQRYKKKLAVKDNQADQPKVRFRLTAKSFKLTNTKFTDTEKRDTLKLIEELRHRLVLLAQTKPELDETFKKRFAQEIDELLLTNKFIQKEIPSNFLQYVELQRQAFADRDHLLKPAPTTENVKK